MNLTGSSSARGKPRGVSKEVNGRPSTTRPTESEPEHLGFVWIICRHPMTGAGLKRILKNEVRVHYQQEPPKEGVPSSVVLCVKDAEALPESIKQVRKLYTDAPVLVFDPHADLPLAWAALKAGARGYVHARMEPDQLVRALRVVSKGELVAPRKLLEYLVTETSNEETADLDVLSPRRREILGLAADGLSNAQIAGHLYLSESTIKQHLRATYKLLGVRNRTQAAQLFRRSTHADRSGP